LRDSAARNKTLDEILGRRDEAIDRITAEMAEESAERMKGYK
jgi:hypothetical protein